MSPRKCLIKHIIEDSWRYNSDGKKRRCKQLLVDLKETKGYWKLKQKVPTHSMGNSPWKRLWTYRKTEHGMNEYESH